MHKLTLVGNSLFITLILCILIGCSGLSGSNVGLSEDVAGARSASGKTVAPGGDDNLSRKRGGQYSVRSSQTESWQSDDDDDRKSNKKKEHSHSDDDDDDDRKSNKKGHKGRRSDDNEGWDD